jgi:hypothetical protein
MVLASSEKHMNFMQKPSKWLESIRIYEGRSSSKVSDFFSQDWEQIDICGLV